MYVPISYTEQQPTQLVITHLFDQKVRELLWRNRCSLTSKADCQTVSSRFFISIANYK